MLPESIAVMSGGGPRGWHRQGVINSHVPGAHMPITTPRHQYILTRHGHTRTPITCALMGRDNGDGQELHIQLTKTLQRDRGVTGAPFIKERDNAQASNYQHFVYYHKLKYIHLREKSIPGGRHQRSTTV